MRSATSVATKTAATKRTSKINAVLLAAPNIQGYGRTQVGSTAESRTSGESMLGLLAV
jgi:hypothetical protein